MPWAAAGRWGTPLPRAWANCTAKWQEDRVAGSLRVMEHTSVEYVEPWAGAFLRGLAVSTK